MLTNSAKTPGNSRELGALRLTNGEFSRLGRYIFDQCGIRMPPSKKTMLESRLHKRLRTLGMTSFAQYCDYLFSDEGVRTETVAMIDLVTTNKTDFFREPDHFAFLTGTMLPGWLQKQDSRGRRTLRVWSAGCSTGEEPYTLAMVLHDFAERHDGFDFRIFASDISTRVLETASLAIYAEDRIRPVPAQFRKRYLLRSKDRQKGVVRVIPELRQMVEFRRINFMENDFEVREPFDIIFCRNVIIYFDRQTQEEFLRRLCGHLTDQGHLFLGHSEAVSGHNLPLKPVFPTVYRKIS